MAGLFGAGLVPVAAGLAGVDQGLDMVPGRSEARAIMGRDGHGEGEAVRVLRAVAQQAQGTGIIGAGAHGGGFQVAIGLVHQNEVGHLHDAALDALQFVAARRGHQQQEHVTQGGDHGFGLTHTHGFDQDDVKAGSLAQGDGLSGAARDAAEFKAGGRGADKGEGVAGEALHPGLVAED